jgi:hypothetical protein
MFTMSTHVKFDIGSDVRAQRVAAGCRLPKCFTCAYADMLKTDHTFAPSDSDEEVVHPWLISDMRREDEICINRYNNPCCTPRHASTRIGSAVPWA